MRRYGFYENYQQEKQREERLQKALLVAHGGSAVTGLLKNLVAAVFYLAAVLLSGVGITTLLYKPLRDIFAGMIFTLIFGR